MTTVQRTIMKQIAKAATANNVKSLKEWYGLLQAVPTEIATKKRKYTKATKQPLPVLQGAPTKKQLRTQIKALLSDGKGRTIADITQDLKVKRSSTVWRALRYTHGLECERIAHGQHVYTLRGQQ